MAFEQRSLDDYIDVAQRIADFRATYPEGSLRPWNPAEPYKLLQAQGFNKDGSVEQQTFVVVVAAAYRHGLDENPGVGMAWEVFPGRTPYTRGSELQNAETSAWGRAIIAIGASDSKRGIASREEVRNRQAEREETPCSCGHAKHYDMDCTLCGCRLRWNRSDGSFSRSRTSDEEKDAAGVMTSAQHKEHTQLAKPPPGREPAERLTGTPADDPWMTAPPVADSRPKPAGWLLSERFAALGVFDRAERLAQCSEIVGRPVGSSNELEPGEVTAILEALQKREVPA
jgi:hypothetical protein